ncbi:acyl-CoA dehydrogenase/oxidase C-terminal, partial [Tilletiaria anomala UBC 951]
MKVEQGFQQRPFDLGDPWSRDPAFRAVVRRLLAPAPPALSAQHISQRLSAFSLRVATQARPWSHPGRCADPVLVNCDNWGRRIDRLETSEGWRRLTQWSVSNGLIGEAYGPKGQEQYLCRKEYDSAGGREALGGYARLYAFARTYLFAPDSRVNVCPTSMQDGAVRTLELYGTDEQQATYLPRLLSRDVETVWIAGQWMTEKPGGSDVAQTETRATRLESLASASSATTAAPMQPGKPGDLYLLDGFKWFSSCPDGNMALALARTSSSASGAGSAGLSLFLLPLRKSARRPIPAHLQRFVPDNNPHNDYNGIRMHRLKKKLGTELVPTAELELDGAIGELIGHEGRGVFYIASVLNLTRLYSASGTCAAISYALNIATDYAGRRRVNATHDAPRGTLLSEVPMHVERLARVNVTHRALLQLVFGTIALLSLSEARRATPEQDVLLRLLTPIAKAFSALRATECYVQCIEALGGQGYMQESGLGDVLKSATVERVWEGTPSVLSHDVKRVLVKSKGLALV